MPTDTPSSVQHRQSKPVPQKHASDAHVKQTPRLFPILADDLSGPRRAPPAESETLSIVSGRVSYGFRPHGLTRSSRPAFLRAGVLTGKPKGG